MRVYLAYPFENYGSGDTADLPNPVARDLIARGRARKAANEPEPEPSADLTLFDQDDDEDKDV